ncbi:hypothetical protein, partial [Salmonella enterica]|uniref:hypothetical protein n=1 Tax=Salmonella enterica TaxID=28901 RepID=UPI003075CE2E
PILQKDYYRLQAFFAGIIPRDLDLPQSDAERTAFAAQLKTWEEATKEIREKIEALEAPVREIARKSAVDRFPLDIQAIYWKPAAEKSAYEK